VLKKPVVLLLNLVAAVSIAHGQAAPTASRVGDLQIGAGYSNADLDFSAPANTYPQIKCVDWVCNRVNGFTGYFDFDTKYHHLGVEGEFRFLKDSPTNIYEKTYEIGARYTHPIKRWVPYGKVLYGRGVFNFADNTITTANLAYNMFAFGGGVDYHLIPSVNLRADFEYQYWLSFPGRTLTPNVFTIGAAYHFH
jgi:opacity protein-like surface antigen